MTSRILANPPAPGTPEWAKIVTASKAPALLGVSRFTSQYAAWHQLAGLIDVDMMDPDRAAWGHIAETSLADWWLHKNPGWQLNVARRGTKEIAYTNDDLPFPNLATIDRRALNRKKGMSSPDRFHIVECKTAMTLDDWGRPGEENAVPADYFTQVLYQMGVSGIHQASIVVLGPFSEPEIHEIEWREDLFAALVDQLAEIYVSTKTGEAPDLDDSLSTYETVRGLHPDIDPEAEVQLDHAQAVAWLDAIVGADEAVRAAQLAKTELAELMGNAKYARVGTTKIADRRSRSGKPPYVQFNKKADLAV
ncbi:YqaJ viral recombinase family protein [Corynebacterium striatum]